MSHSENETPTLTPLQRALFAVKDMRSRLDAIERTRSEPIAIVGAGCRFPGGVVDLDSFWKLMKERRDAITEVPSDRWDLAEFYDSDPSAPGKMTTRWGGFVDNVDLFDASFFGIAPREAASMDPQQRLFLEVVWEALENAGISPASLNGSLTGVFAGISTSDYFQLRAGSGDLGQIDAYTGTGGAFSVAAGRVSYALGLNGPNLPVDTACSSSLVAVHLACQSLRQGECNLAVAGGVNLILSPSGTIYFSKLRAMAQDGRCKTFDAAADGYVRSEGCGFVVLERLSDAQAHGHEILAVVLGSAVNHDGRSGGLTAPSRFAQQAVLRSALAAAAAKPSEIAYVEAHGTGTPLGDPIELAALAAVMGEGRDNGSKLLVGSVKTNIGHTEAAAGIAGLIKVALALRKGSIPAHLHFQQPNPYVPWTDIPITVSTNEVAWPADENRRRLAGVSSFGFSGTNAHVILGEAPRPTNPIEPEKDRLFHLLPLSARTQGALTDLVGRYAQLLGKASNTSLPDLCHTAGVGRSHFGFRSALVIETDDVQNTRRRLLSYPQNVDAEGVYRNAKEKSGAPRLAFLFGNEKMDYVGAGRMLYETQPAFRSAMDQCDNWLQGALIAFLYRDDMAPLSNAADLASAALFAFEYSLAEMWRSWGVLPDMVLGQGVGEFAAACVAGIFTWQEGLELLIKNPDVKPAYQPGRVQLIATATGDVLRLNQKENSDYWQRRESVPDNLGESIRTAKRLGCEVIVEIGSDPILPAQADLIVLPTLDRRESDWKTALKTVAQLYVEGAEIDWSGIDRGFSRKTIPVPTYPFQRQRYWSDVATKPLSPGKLETLQRSENGLLYELKWELVKANRAAEKPLSPGTWLLLADSIVADDSSSESTVLALARLIKERGGQAICVVPGDEYHSEGPTWRICRDDPRHFDRLIHDVGQSTDLPYIKIVSFWNAEGVRGETSKFGDVVEESAVGCTFALHLVQALARIEGKESPTLHLVTRGIHAIAATDLVSGLPHSVIWGFGRAVALEHSSFWGGMIDLEGQRRDDDALAVFSEISASGKHEESAYRAGLRYEPRLTPVAPSSGKIPVLRSEATYLITGGLGALGLQVLSWLAALGARHILLVGRNSPLPDVEAVLQQYRDNGIQVSFQRADVSRSRDVQDLLVNMPPGFPSIRGIVHAAGILEDGFINGQSDERLARVFAPKVAGAWNLHAFSEDLALDFFILFSSATALFGSPGQASYSAANAFLDSLAHYRRQRKQCALSLNWGPFHNVGMAKARRSVGGISELSLEQGNEAFRLSLCSELSQLAVVPFQWHEFAAQFPDDVPPLVRALLPKTKPAMNQPEKEPGQLLAELLRGEVSARLDGLASYLKLQLCRIAGVESEAISPTKDFFEIGIDSLMAMELIQSVRQDLRIALYPREFYEHPDISSLASYLSIELEKLHGAATAIRVSVPGPPISSVAEAPKERRAAPEEPVSGVVMLLSSPRSGSTLLRVMLAGHPDLFCPPELHLLPFDTMGERRAKLASSYLDEGLQRAFMEAGGMDVQASRALVNDLAERDVPVVEVYRMLKQMVGSRLLVDKSPTYASDLMSLKQAELLLKSGRYIHLVRHPGAMIESFARNRMDKLVGHTTDDPATMAAQLWVAGNVNLLEFLKEVEPARQTTIRFEALVREEERVMRELCDFLDVPFDPAVLRPYEGQRMTDGVHAKSLAIGDPGFLSHDRIDPGKADVWRNQILTPQVIALLEPAASALGYDLSDGVLPVASEAGAVSGFRERYVGVRGRQFCLCEWGAADGAPILLIHGMLDHGGAWEQVALILAQQGFHVIAPDLRGHGRSDHQDSGSSYHLLDFVADVDAIAAMQSPHPLPMVGHSLGAGVAALYAAARPGKIASLVLVELPALPPLQSGVMVDRFVAQLDQFAAAAKHPVFADINAVVERLRKSIPSLSVLQAEKDALRLTRACEGGLAWRWDPRLRTRSVAGIEALSGEFYADVLARLGENAILIYGTSGIMADGRSSPPKKSPARQLTIVGGHNLHLDAPGHLARAISEAVAGESLTIGSEVSR